MLETTASVDVGDRSIRLLDVGALAVFQREPSGGWRRSRSRAMTLCHCQLFQYDWAEQNGYTLSTTLIEIVVYRV